MKEAASIQIFRHAALANIGLVLFSAMSMKALFE